MGPSTSTTPEITFTTDSYEGTAETYYAVVPNGDGPPDIAAYMLLNNSVPAGENHEGTITLLADQIGGDYDIL